QYKSPNFRTKKQAHSPANKSTLMQCTDELLRLSYHKETKVQTG
ncbi:MAG: hypothetical protein ACI8WM_002065, partial [Burkholderiaceae bacterium]